MFARLRAKHESVAPLVKMSLALIWAGSVALAVVVFFSRTELVAWMFPEKNTVYRADTLGILIWVFVPVSVTYVFSTLLTADGRLMQMNRFFLVAVGLDVLLNLILTPNLQAQGAALSALITQTFVAGSMVFLCVREFRFSFHWRHWGPLLAYAVLLLSGAWVVFHFVQWPWIGQVGAVLALAGAAALGLGLVKPQAWIAQNQ
jgi:O-antigen/teichoic acid export membrane protein